MIGRTNMLRLALVATLGMVLGLAAFAAAPPFAIAWQGTKAPMPNGCGWAAQTEFNGKIYVFGGNTATETETALTLNTTQIYDPVADKWTLGAPMPTARYLATACVVNSKIYVMGGRTVDSAGGGGPVDSNEVYDPATNTWSTAKATPLPIRGHAAAAANNKIFVFGGNTGSYQKTVNIFDPATNAWSTGAAMGVARAYGYAVAVPAKNRIYVIGGGNGGTTASSYIGNAIAYDPTANTWDSTPIPMAENEFPTYFGACLAGTKIFVFPGQTWDKVANTDYRQSDVTQVYDTMGTGGFTAVSALSPSPLVRVEARASTIDGKIYLIGGTASRSSVDVFDPASGSWFEGNAPLPDYLGSTNMAAVGGKLYLLNGGNSQAANAFVYAYDPAAGTWTKTNATNPKPRNGAVSDVWNGKIVMANGDDGQNGKGDAQSFDPATGTFAALATDSTPTTGACGAVAGNSLYVFGGYDTVTKASVATGRGLDLSSGSWSAKANLPAAMDGATAVGYNGKVYIFGGYDNSSDDGVSDNVLIYDPASNAITTGARMAVPVIYATSAVYKNYIIITGGLNSYLGDSGTVFRMAPFFQVYDPAADLFTSAPIIYFRENHNAAVIGDTFYQTGGSDHTYLEDRLDIAALGSVGPTPLSASASADKTSGPIPLTVQFTGRASGGTPPYTYLWVFGDEKPNSTDQNPSHTYAAAGSFTAKLTVTDGASATASSTLTIKPNSTPPPVITAMKKSGGPFRFTVSGSNLQSGIKVYINNAEYSGVFWKTTSKVLIKGSDLKTKVPKGVLTHFKFVNIDGGEALYDWSW